MENGDSVRHFGYASLNRQPSLHSPFSIHHWPGRPLYHLLIIGLCSSSVLAAPTSQPSVAVEGQRITARTATVTAVFEGAALVSLTPAGEEAQFAHPTASARGVDLTYLNGEILGDDKHQTVSVKQLSPLAARVDVAGDMGRRTLCIGVDAASGDVLVTPDGLSDRRGVRAVRWTVSLEPSATLILPAVNGLIVRPDAPHPSARRFGWPFEWNAQLAVIRREGWTAMIHAEDRDCRFKALQMTRTGPRIELGFESESPGPLWDNRTAGGVTWRVNAYQGDWQVPAKRYRAWMEAAYDLAGKRAGRPAWIEGVRMAFCWAGSNPAMLEAMAAVHPPSETLIHLSGWRTSKYDVDYPDYVPSEQDLAFMAKAREMGFHVMPHFNYFAIDIDHPVFEELGPWQLRTVDRNVPDGWNWPPETYDYTRMAYLHPGLGRWRETLIERTLEACAKMGTDVAFLDQTLCTWNTDNGLVQGMNTVQGMRELQERFAAVQPGLVLAGEGLNEISFQRQAFAQAHILDGWGKLEPKHLEVQHGINAFLWAGHTRMVGYYHLTPGQADMELGVGVYERMGAIPTLITGNPKDLSEPSELTKRVLERARGEK